MFLLNGSLQEISDILIDYNFGGGGKGNCVLYNKITKILHVSFRYNNTNTQNGTKVGQLPSYIPYPLTVRSINFIATNTDVTTSAAELTIMLDGSLYIYNTVDKNMDCPIVNGFCYLG